MIRRPFGFDLFRWAVGVIEVGVAVLLLIIPSQLSSPAYAYIRSNSLPYGLLLLMAGGQFVTLAAIRPVADRRPSFLSGAFAAIPLFLLGHGFLLASATTGAVLNDVLGLGCLLGPFLVRPSDVASLSGTGDVLFYAIGLAQLVDGALMILVPRFFPLLMAGGVSPFFPELGWLLVIAGLLLFLAHLWRGTPEWLVGVSHVLAALAFVPLLQTGITTADAWIGLIYYVSLDAFLIASPLFYGKPGLARRDTLAVRLSALIVLIAAVPLVYMSIVTAENVRSAIQQHVSDDQLTLAKVSTNRLMDLLATSQQEIDALGHVDGIRGMDSATQRGLLVAVGRALPQFTSIVTCDLDGDQVARSDDAALGYSGDREFFQTARSGHVTWQLLFSGAKDQPSIVFAAPIRGGDQRVNGVLFGTVGRDELAEIIDASALEAGSRVFVIDQQGRVVVASGANDAAASPVRSLPSIAVADGIVTLPIAGDSYLAGVSSVEPPGWRVVVAMRESTAFAAIDRIQKVTLLTFAVAILGVLAAAGAIARLIAGPVTRLTAAAEALARGDDGPPMPKHASGEVGVLVTSFESMRAALQAHAAALVAREHRARGVASVALALGHSHGFENALTALCRELMIALDGSFCAAFLLENGDLVAHGLSAVDRQVAEAHGATVPVTGDSLVSQIFRAGEAALIGGNDAFGRADQIVAEHPAIKSGLAVPLTVGGERRGVLLAIELERAERLGISELELVRAVVGTADLVLENASLDEENERRRIEAEQLASRNAELYAMERATADALRDSQAEMERFVYTVSHDLRAPLVTIQGFTQRVLQRAGAPLDDRARDYLDRVQKNAQRLEALINDLLQLSRIGRAELDVQPVSLKDLAEDVRGQIAVQLENRGIAFVVADEIPPIVANRHRLGQVLENLVENAILYMGASRPPEQPTIRLGACEIDDGWRVWVSDNGVGIPEEFRERVFNVFERLSAGKAAHPEGTGIGLATVKKIVDAHGGRVWIEDTPGGGTTVTFTIAVGRKDEGWPVRQ
ncbi:MAG: sensor histidine kinase [Chloroflexota bacterium]